MQHLDAETLRQDQQNPHKLHVLKTSGGWLQLNSIVRLILQVKAGPGLLDSEAVECGQWLAMLQACCSVFRERDHTEFDEGCGDLVQAAGNGVLLFPVHDAATRARLRSLHSRVNHLVDLRSSQSHTVILEF